MFTHNLINAIGHSMQVRVPWFSLFAPILLWLVAFVTPSIIYVTVYLNKSHLCSEKFKKLKNESKKISIDLF